MKIVLSRYSCGEGLKSINSIISLLWNAIHLSESMMKISNGNEEETLQRISANINFKDNLIFNNHL